MKFLGTFECGNANQFTSAGGTVQTTVKKEDSYAGKNTDNTSFIKTLDTSYQHSWSGAWFRWDGTVGNDWFVLLGEGATTNQFTVKTSSGKLKIIVNGITYEGSKALLANTWYFIMVEFHCADSGGYFRVYVDGLLDITVSGVDSKSGSDTGIKTIKWQGTNSATVNCYIDNCAFWDYDPHFVMKIAKAGKDVSSMDIKNLLFHSDYAFLKFHSEHSTSVTFNAGDTEKSVTIAHSLGYVPAFVAYVEYDGQTYIVPSIPYGIDFQQFPYAYATSSGITVGFKMESPYNQIIVYKDQIYYEFFYDGVGLVVGNPGSGGKSTAYRFPGVAVARNESLVSANLEITHVFSGSTDGDTKYKIWGIDEDNVGDVDLGKAKTDAFDARNQSKVGGWWNFGTDVLDQVNEIIARGGWNSGNNMGFILNDDASDGGKYIGADNDTSAKLTLVKPGTKTINFKIIIFKDKIAT